MTGFARSPIEFVNDAATAAERVDEYYAPGFSVRRKKRVARGYHGQAFDRIAHESPCGRFTWADMAAVASLSLIVPGAVAQEIIDSELLRRLLQAILTDVSIAEDRANRLLEPSEAASELYESIRQFQGMGPARTSKLLAAKRPRLIPIRDSVVQRELGASTMWWRSMLEEWSGSDLPDAVTGVRAKCRNLPAYVTDLRILDVAIWMLGKVGD